MTIELQPVGERHAASADPRVRRADRHAISTSRAGAISSRCLPTSSPTCCTRARRRWSTGGLPRGTMPIRSVDARPSRRSSRRTCEFKDRFGLTGGVEELLGHIAAVHQFMPGLRLERQGETAALSGTGPGRLGGGGSGRHDEGPGNERLRAVRRRAHCGGHGLLVEPRRAGSQSGAGSRRFHLSCTDQWLCGRSAPASRWRCSVSPAPSSCISRSAAGRRLRRRRVSSASTPRRPSRVRVAATVQRFRGDKRDFEIDLRDAVDVSRRDAPG